MKMTTIAKKSSHVKSSLPESIDSLIAGALRVTDRADALEGYPRVALSGSVGAALLAIYTTRPDDVKFFLVGAALSLAGTLGVANAMFNNYRMSRQLGRYGKELYNIREDYIATGNSGENGEIDAAIQFDRLLPRSLSNMSAIVSDARSGFAITTFGLVANSVAAFTIFEYEINKNIGYYLFSAGLGLYGMGMITFSFPVQKQIGEGIVKLREELTEVMKLRRGKSTIKDSFEESISSM